MATNSNSTNQQSGENQGAPAGEGLPQGSGDLPANEPDAETQARLEQEALDAGLRHPNRNLDKPQLDQPSYGGGH